ncbi:MAG: tetratricopeptide repeat protein [Phycisphaeraceae bacterium]|nr:tetratricopeptide repeat protein [Phycisphaeraceae bacterium]
MHQPSIERERKERLLRMLEVAQAYRGCSKAQLAHYLDRDPAKIAPDSGNPKLDLIFNLADLVEWPVGDLAEALWGRHDSRTGDGERKAVPDGDFRQIDALVREAHRRGDYAEMRRLGERMLDLAATPLERAGARMRVGNAWLDEGRFTRALEWLQAAADEHEAPGHVLEMVRVNLATAHLALWNLSEAEGLARLVLLGTASLDRASRRIRVTEAHAHYVIGSALQRKVQSMSLEAAPAAAIKAIDSLRRAQADHEALHREFDDPTYQGIANTCRAAILEMEVEAGILDLDVALASLMLGLDEVIDPSSVRGDLLESWGWWCVSGLMLALRRLDGDEQQRAAAVFSNKAFELADATGSWALRERAFCLGHLSSQACGSVDPAEVMLDTEDLRSLVGTMGRFPRFRPTGWQILRRFMGVTT